MRIPLIALFFAIAVGSFPAKASVGEVLFTDGFDDALSMGGERPACPPWSRAGSPKDDDATHGTRLEADQENRFGEGDKAAVALLYDNSPDKQAYLLGYNVFDARAVELSFDFFEPEGADSGGAFFVTLTSDGERDGQVAVRLSFVKGELLRRKAAYPVDQKVHIRLIANNNLEAVTYDGRMLQPRTFDVWVNDHLAIENEPFPAEAKTVAPGAAVTGLGFLTFSGQTTGQKVYLRNIKVSSLP